MSGNNMVPVGLQQLLARQTSEATNNLHRVHGSEDACMPMEADNTTSRLAPKDPKSAELAQLLFAHIFSSPSNVKPKAAAHPLRLPRQRSNNTYRSSSLAGPDTPLASLLPARSSPRKRTRSLRYTSDDYEPCDEVGLPASNTLNGSGALLNKEHHSLVPAAWGLPQQQQEGQEGQQGQHAEAEVAAWTLMHMSRSQEPCRISQPVPAPGQPEAVPVQAAAPMDPLAMVQAARAATAMALQQPTISPAELQQACLQLAAHFNAQQAALNAAVMAGTASSPVHSASLGKAPASFGSSAGRAASAESGLESAALTTPKRKQARMYTFSEDESVFSREIRAKIPDSTQQAIRQQWQATGRMAVTCGTAGKQGLAGIFTLDPAGKPVIWVPTTTAAAARLGQLVAAGGGSLGSMVCIPAGYEPMEPKEFEARAGRQGTRNWQLSILLADFSVMSSPKGKAQAVKLGHFVRIVGIPTAKAA